jgi:hypothetical protein
LRDLGTADLIDVEKSCSNSRNHHENRDER